jgi:multiple antibiotic resistance protein
MLICYLACLGVSRNWGCNPCSRASRRRFAGRAYGNLLLVGLLLAVVAFVSLACLAAFLLAGRLSRLLGLTGDIVLSRLLGVLLAALAVQYVIDGIRAVLTG